MRAELLAIGDEITSGQIADTNSAWLAAELRESGIGISRISAVGDRVEEIAAVLREAAGRKAPLLVATGGLGPTFDDLTRDAAAAFAGVGLAREPAALAHLEKWFAHRSRPMPPENLRQADLPEGSEMLVNPLGTAPGFALGTRGGAPAAGPLLFFLPGVPHEMETMFREQVMPRIRDRFPAASTLAPFKIHLFGLWESEADRRLRGEFTAPEMRHLGIRVAGGAITVAVYGDPDLDAGQVARAVAGFPERLRALFPDVAFGEGSIGLAGALVEALRSKGGTIAAAESCTGGLVASLITAVPGASEVFERSWVVYSDEAKVDLLGVAPETIREWGAVSEPVARALAGGALERSRGDVAVAVTGIAGPTGGTPEKPVGLVWFAAARKTPSGPRIASFFRKFNGARTRVQLLSAYTALDLARRTFLSP